MTFNMDWWLALTVLLSPGYPLLVGLITTRLTDSGVKSNLLAALSAISGLGFEVLHAHQAGVSYNLATGLLMSLVTFATAVGTHYGFWKPKGIDIKAQETLRKSEIPSTVEVPVVLNRSVDQGVDA